MLVQHLVTVALGGGFSPDALLQEVRSTAAYADLSDDAWAWCLAFVSQGGASLSAYPDHQRAGSDTAGIWRVPNAQLARRHRMNIGTIVSDASMASSSLFYEVFRKYDPDNLLLAQARTELLAEELDITRLQDSLTRMGAQQLVIKAVARPTPFSFPLMVERLREKLSNESMADRITRMVQQLEKDAGGAPNEASQTTCHHLRWPHGLAASKQSWPNRSSD